MMASQKRSNGLMFQQLGASLLREGVSRRPSLVGSTVAEAWCETPFRGDESPISRLALGCSVTRTRSITKTTRGAKVFPGSDFESTMASPADACARSSARREHVCMLSGAPEPGVPRRRQVVALDDQPHRRMDVGMRTTSSVSMPQLLGQGSESRTNSPDHLLQEEFEPFPQKRQRSKVRAKGDASHSRGLSQGRLASDSRRDPRSGRHEGRLQSPHLPRTPPMQQRKRYGGVLGLVYDI